MTVLPNVRRIGGPAGAVFSARLAAAALGIFVQLLLARLLGPEQLGLYFLATSLATVGAVVAAGGYPNIVLKIVAGGRNGEERGRALAGVALRDCAVAIIVVSALIAAAAMLSPDRAVLLVALIALPVIVFGRLLSAYAMAHRRPLAANLPELLARPAIIAAGLALLLAAGMRVDAVDAAWLFAAGAGTMLAVVSTWMALGKGLPHIAFTVDRRVRRRLRRRALPLAPVSVLSAFFGDLAIVVSGLFLAPAELGVFALSLKIALLIGFAIQALYQVELPGIAAAHGKRLVHEVRSAIERLNRTAVLATFAGAVMVVPLAPRILSWFGDGFVAGANVLVILVVVQVARAYCGPSIQALTLVSAQRASSVLSMAAALTLFAGCAALAPAFGALGAAFATALAILVWFGVAAYLAARHGLSTAGLGGLSGRTLPRRIATWRSA